MTAKTFSLPGTIAEGDYKGEGWGALLLRHGAPALLVYLPAEPDADGNEVFRDTKFNLRVEDGAMPIYEAWFGRVNADKTFTAKERLL